MLSVLFFVLVACRRQFFCPNHVKKALSSQAIILEVFDQNVGLCYVRVFRLLWATVVTFVESSNDAR